MAPIIVVMGVSGSGKSTVGVALAKELGWPFMEGDDLHPSDNIAKMRSGFALNDNDRRPWLAMVAHWIDARRQSGERGIVTCSALKRSYREFLVEGRPNLIFIYLKTSIAVANHRSQSRRRHFMPPSLLSDQFGILEEPASDEPVIIIDAERPIQTCLDEIKISIPTDGSEFPLFGK